MLAHDGWIRRVRLEAGASVVIGRSSECDVVIGDPSVSRRHARVWRDPRGSWIEDLGSGSGTTVRGQRIQGEHALAQGVEIGIGAILARLEPRPARSVLSGDLGRDHRNVQLLLDAVGDLQGAPTVEQLLRTVVDRAIALTGTDRGALLLAGPEGRLEVAVARDVGGHDLRTDSPFTRSIPARALSSGRAIVFDDDDLDAGDGASPSIVAGALRAVLSAPLPGTSGPVGVLYVDGQRPAGGFGPSELAIFEALAVHAAVAIERARLRDDQERREQATLRRLKSENASLKAQRADGAPLGESPPMVQAKDLLRRVAPSEATVLLCGETGTGKEVLARWLHASSPRAGGPFVVVDCGAIPEGLIESELFGHVKGAFTGAAGAREGRFREADGGTVFLDEIGELPLALQTRLLRVLQEHTVQPVGATGRVPVDVRVVCATHRQLKERVAAGQFREDLFYRISVVAIDVPALRDRGDDTLLLAQRFLARIADRGGGITGFTPEAQAALLRHRWPGNVRELENRVQRAALMARPPFATVQDLGFEPVVGASAIAAEVEGALAPLQEARAEASLRFEREYVAEALKRAQGRVGIAAELAGVSRQMLQRLMSRHGLDRRAYRDDAS